MYSNLSIVKILWRYKKHETLTKEELSELKAWLSVSSLHEELFDDLSNTQKWDRDIAEKFSGNSQATWETIKERVEELSPTATGARREIGWWKYGVAAAVLAILFCGVYYLKIDKRSGIEKNTVARFKNEVLPEKGAATLTLSDGSVIGLDSAKKGELGTQGNTVLTKKDSGQLDYSLTAIKTGTPQYNTLTTARGCQYLITLPDGSKVWLNAASSLRYPVAFTGHDRRVELRGEAYFEVTANKEKPFLVLQNDLLVRVLGTRFNVNGYSDNLLFKTSVLEGSVALRSGMDSLVIKPGEEVSRDQRGKISLMSINAEQAIAWKEKLFWFQAEPFDQIMRELSRWYDIDVIFQGKPSKTFTGLLPCNLPLTNLLSILEQGGNVSFTIEGKKVIVKS